jgi:hypothetical protein
VLEHLPGERVSVRTSDGSVRNIPWEEVERVEEGAASAPAPAQSTFEQFPTELGAAPATQVPASAPEPAWPAEGELSSSKDEERFDDVTLSLFGLLGILGNASVDFDAMLISSVVGTMTVDGSDDADLELSYGGGAQLDVPLHRYFSLAPQIRLTSWRPETSEGSRRALFVDFLAAPRLRLPFVLSKGSIGVAYLQVPVGLSIVDLPEGGDADASASSAFAFGVSGGFLALLSKHVGLVLELGWIQRWFSVDTKLVEVTDGLEDTVILDAMSDWSVTQVTIQLGLVIAF